MTDDDYIMPVKKAIELIQKSYIDRVFLFMNKKVTSVANPKEFVKVCEIVMRQCDEEANSIQLHAYFKEQLTSYIKRDLLPHINA
jgi:hypothetical protein